MSSFVKIVLAAVVGILAIVGALAVRSRTQDGVRHDEQAASPGVSGTSGQDKATEPDNVGPPRGQVMRDAEAVTEQELAQAKVLGIAPAVRDFKPRPYEVDRFEKDSASVIVDVVVDDRTRNYACFLQYRRKGDFWKLVDGSLRYFLSDAPQEPLRNSKQVPAERTDVFGRPVRNPTSETAPPASREEGPRSETGAEGSKGVGCATYPKRPDQKQAFDALGLDWGRTNRWGAFVDLNGELRADKPSCRQILKGSDEYEKYRRN